MEEYASNSHKSKEEKTETVTPDKRVNTVANGKRRETTKSKNLINKVLSDDADDITEYVIDGIIKPSFNKLVMDVLDCFGNVIMDTVSLHLTGDTRPKKHSKSGGRTSYDKYYKDKEDRERKTYTRSSKYKYDEVEFETRKDAENALLEMWDAIDEYDFCSVGDLYDIAHISGATFTDQKYGWDDLEGVRPVRSGGMWILDLPRPISIDKGR